MKTIVKIKLPIHIYLLKKKRISINLNTYRNIHYRTNNTLKHKYKEIVFLLLKEAKVKSILYKHISIDYQLVLKNNRRLDTMNFITIADKFLMDAIVDYGLILDDSWKEIKDIFIHQTYVDNKIKDSYIEVTIIGEE